MNTPLISVVIPVYNGETTIIDTLTSVLKQTYANFEVIIVDDGSDHPVESFLQPLTDDKRIRVYRTERSNANIARNVGIMESKGEYIAMLDADDCWVENHLNDCLLMLQETTADGLYGSLFMNRSRPVDIQNLPVAKARELKAGESMMDYLLTAGYGAQTSTLFTTARSMKDILWDPELIDMQDYDFVFRFYNKYKMIVKKDPTVVYTLGSGRSLHYESIIRYMKDHKKDIDPEVYMRYHLNMYWRVKIEEESKQFIPYFHKEATRYPEYLSYFRFISICNPQSRFREWMDKLKYVFTILRIQIQ